MAFSRNGWFRSFFSRFGYGGTLVAAIVAVHFAQQSGLEAERATFAVVLPFTLLLLLIEQLIPHADEWKPTWRSWGLDLIHSGVIGLAVAPLVRAGLFSLLVLAGARIAEHAGVALWPTDMPLVVQLPLALFISDFGVYCAHRFMHLTRVGWRMHAVHHSPEKLHVMASARTHPFNAVLTLACETGPLIFLGISPEALAAWTVFKAVNGLLQHSNIDLRPGWLSYVVATSDVHRYHHSVHLDESNSNFGNTTMIWDHVFRTFHLPKGEVAGLDVGIDDAAIPETYWAHLAAPFILGRYEADAQRDAKPDAAREAIEDASVDLTPEVALG